MSAQEHQSCSMQAKIGTPKQLRCGWARGGGREGRDDRAGLRGRPAQGGGWGSRDRLQHIWLQGDPGGLAPSSPTCHTGHPAVLGLVEGVSAYQLSHPTDPQIIPFVAPKPLTLSPWHSALLSQFPFLCRK